MKISPQYRQGDVIIERVAKIKRENPMERENGKVILAHGEVTGHTHAIADEAVNQYRLSPGLTELEITEAVALLQHEEHSTIELPTGKYRVTRQLEYTPQEIRNVAD